jgi:hypothetical protein
VHGFDEIVCADRTRGWVHDPGNSLALGGTPSASRNRGLTTAIPYLLRPHRRGSR